MLKSIVRVTTVLLLSAVAVSASIPFFFHEATSRPWGYYGFEGDVSGTIIDVKPGGAAALAGLKAGDRIDLAAMPLEYQRDYNETASFSPGKISEFQVVRGSKHFAVRLVSQPGRMSRSHFIWGTIQRITTVVTVIIGSLLLLFRPSKMTWGFYLFCLSSVAWDAPFLFLHWGWLTAALTLKNLLFMLGPLGFLVFALRFPRDVAAGWKGRIDTFAPVLTVALAVTTSASAGGAGLMPTASMWASQTLQRTAEVAVTIMYVAAAAALTSTFLTSSGEDRQRLRWVIAGCMVGFAGFPLQYLVYNAAFPQIPEWIARAVSPLPVLIPLAVAYGIFKHRVIDLRFVLSRALAYGVLVACLAVLLVLVDLLSVRFLSGTPIQTAILVAAAVALGFAGRPLVARAQTFIDRIFFRAQLNARDRLSASTDAIRRARTFSELELILTRGVAEALNLTSAAVFLARGDGGFIRGFSVEGWSSDRCSHILPDDSASTTFDVRSASRLSRSAFIGLTVPDGVSLPVLALPVRTDGALRACCLYGAHANGADFNPEEISELRWLAAEAANTWRFFESLGMSPATVPS
jgi:hypothetical protein